VSSTRPAAVIVLAAGEGTRMKSATPKVLHRLGGRSLIGHVVVAARALQPEHLLVVVGHSRDQVTEHLAGLDPDAVAVVQEEQRGTGHAVRIALDSRPALDGTVVVLPGDAPLQTTETLTRLVNEHDQRGSAATVLSAVVPDPTGYGRVLRDAAGVVTGIVEHKDATGAQRTVAEINSGTYAFDAKLLRDAIGRLTTDNVQGEEYLTDVLGLLSSDGRPVDALAAEDYHETLGCNDRVQLAALARLLRDRIVEQWMRDGVSVLDPATTWIDVDVTLEPDAVVHPNTQLHGNTAVGRGAEVGPDCTLYDTVVGPAAHVVRAHCVNAEIGPEAQVGPYSYLRPGAVLGRGAKVGAFVEVKASRIGTGSKVPHLSYVGDATIGERSNVGAATVFVNYDGMTKHRTTVGDHVRIGSDTMLVAPVSIGDGAYTAAGSVVTDDVPPGAMAVARARQRNVEGWVERRRAGTPAAEAARAANQRKSASSQLPTGQREREDGDGDADVTND
jgi:bifunctional UDP-N-acetylglucosamine pyrophosphorylase / glucosamine-1-phosphate N-acetyltransferase